ncbi:MAG TPA: YchF/TatD family DNA exonuclease [Ignavibacteriaceae bacterium]|nr:YchF/TatD family DNA exonuclease [Ignavibacteriaceae bacterium]
MFIDTHAHLFYPNFNGDLADVIQKATDANVSKIIVPATDLSSCTQVVELTKKFPQIYGTVGIHPHDTREWDSSILKNLEELTKNNKIVAIGEIGLDYYYDFSPKDKQINAFKEQIALALKLNLPIVVHNREADDDILKILSEYSSSGLRAQLHCFNSTLSHAREFVKMGFYISFTGNITFKKADDLRKIASSISMEHLLLETDSPFMTPVPFRGKRNEPSNIPLIAQTLAELHHLTIEDVGRITTYNTFKLFGIGDKPEVSFTYKIGDALYINVTNRCNADCFFCDHKGEAVISGYNLKMSKSDEPNVEVYINEIGNPTLYKEIVFCGYGEPTIRWDVIKEVAKFVKSNGGKTRLNTNGHGNFINKRNIVSEMKGIIDTVSISLNSIDSKKYSEIMRVEEMLFFEIIDFAKQAKESVDRVILTVVDIDDADIPNAQNFVNQFGLEFRVRNYF